MIDVSYVCKVIFVVMGTPVLSFIIVYFANPCSLFCLRVSVVYRSWLGECSFSLTICRQDLRDLIAVLICLAKVLFCLDQFDL